eukprot:CAMPEP_0185611924 /NCGR_PEP_ID=MMETSP0436-20130131/18213_1 /TAXON_ID=626734 ORGANISM="Favella taraikaensis, Strain Fe Narragansett Bay" /NCGR_SAMPLE_ID=MMETSP0436 /ASSEMBLY_ACC=CAM_ASM_000390 /LENGTH=56 /DNA_ID=CAMNT_0028244995 /DNA_START=876 /DNA_END=1042 /DNA_ORIENTATION=-
MVTGDEMLTTLRSDARTSLTLAQITLMAISSRISPFLALSKYTSTSKENLLRVRGV